STAGSVCKPKEENSLTTQSGGTALRLHRHLTYFLRYRTSAKAWRCLRLCLLCKEPVALQKIFNPSLSADNLRPKSRAYGPVGLRNAPAGAVRRRRRHRQGNFTANCVRGTK